MKSISKEKRQQKIAALQKVKIKKETMKQIISLINLYVAN